jgi:hypothetical protein
VPRDLSQVGTVPPCTCSVFTGLGGRIVSLDLSVRQSCHVRVFWVHFTLICGRPSCLLYWVFLEEIPTKSERSRIRYVESQIYTAQQDTAI